MTDDNDINDDFDWVPINGRLQKAGRGAQKSKNVRRSLGRLPRSPTEALEPAKAPKPPSHKIHHGGHPFLLFLNGAMTLFLVMLIGLGASFYYIKFLFDQNGPLNHPKIITIPEGEGVNAIATRLVREGIIRDRIIFVASTIYFKAQKKLRAGEYEISKQASIRQVLDSITKGKSILYQVTIPEGWTSEQIVARLKTTPALSGEIAQVPPEGSLLPDTYKFTRGMKRHDILQWMQAEQQKFLAKLWESRDEDLPYDTPEQAIILASIVEKETGRADERRRIASVFINRLKKKIRLQSDPTIIYGLVGGKGSLGHPILRSELRKKTAYNTYQIDGLPPTPIANPSRAAIEAVLKPEKTNDLFFVADGTGRHIFSPTFAGHRKNVIRWRKIEKEMRAQQQQIAEKKKAEEERAALALRLSSQDATTDTTSAVQGANIGGQNEAAFADREPPPDQPEKTASDLPGVVVEALPSTVILKDSLDEKSSWEQATQSSIQKTSDITISAVAGDATPPSSKAQMIASKPVPLPVRKPPSL